MILLFSFFIYIFISQYSYTDFYKRLEIRSYSVAKSELDPKGGGFIKQFKGEYLEPLTDEKHYVIELEGVPGLVVQAQKNNLPLEFLTAILENGKGTYQDGELFYAGIKYSKGDKIYLVITSAINYYYGHHNAYLRNLLIIFTILSTVLIILISYWFSKRIITPIINVTEQVNKIGTENLHSRIPGYENDDEMGQLVKTFNNMLDRLETSFETQNNFISNASHELNTPLTSIIGQADVALTRPRKKEEYIEALQNILLEADKLDKKTKALLYLAQTGFNGKTISFSKVRIDQLVFDVHETINRLHPENKVVINLSDLPETPEKLKVNGNEQLLHLAISNIVLNAYKYSSNQKVVITIHHDKESVFIIVDDKGIGIPESELKYIYDPFFRASNTASFEGYGIGLPLTRNIIKLHKGEMFIKSTENQGTIVRIKIPIGQFKL